MTDRSVPTTSAQATRSSDSPLRLFLIATLLPAAIVVVDESALRFGMRQHWTLSAAAVVYALFVGQVALLGVVIARHVRYWFLRWTILGWVLALIDLRLFALMVTGAMGNYSLSCMTYALWSGQLGLLAFCAALGPAPWPWRLPAVAVGALFVAYGVVSFSVWDDVWVLILLIQTLVLVGLCVVLRLWGFRMELAAREAHPHGESQPAKVFQFSIQHMLFWAAALVPLLVLAPKMDLWILGLADLSIWVRLLYVGVCLSIVPVLVIWAVLGRGRPVACIPLLAGMPLATGSLLAVTVTEESWMVRTWGLSWWLSDLVEIRWWWIAWSVLAACFLAGLLLVFRAGGYRLVRHSPKVDASL